MHLYLKHVKKHRESTVVFTFVQDKTFYYQEVVNGYISDQCKWISHVYVVD